MTDTGEVPARTGPVIALTCRAGGADAGGRPISKTVFYAASVPSLRKAVEVCWVHGADGSADGRSGSDG